MKDNIAVVLIYAAFCSVIGTACYVTKSAWPLFAFIFTPTITSTNDKKEKDE